MKLKRNFSTVTIELGYTALIDLKRFYLRGIRCARDQHDGYEMLSCKSHKTILQALASASQTMTLYKAEAAIAKAEKE
jgi:hypothetical protein